MYRATVERESFAARGRKRVNSGQGDARLYIASGMAEEIDNFFNRDEDLQENIFNLHNRYFVNLENLRQHMILSQLEWFENITETDYRMVNHEVYSELFGEINQHIHDFGDLISLGGLERNA